MKPLLYSGINAKKIRAALFSNLGGTFQQWLTGGEPDRVCDDRGPLHQPTPAEDSIIYKSVFTDSLECIK